MAEAGLRLATAAGVDRLNMFRFTLAEALGSRFDAFGDIDDLNRAIKTYSSTDEHPVPGYVEDGQRVLAMLLRRLGRNDEKSA